MRSKPTLPARFPDPDALRPAWVPPRTPKTAPGWTLYGVLDAHEAATLPWVPELPVYLVPTVVGGFYAYVPDEAYAWLARLRDTVVVVGNPDARFHPTAELLAVLCGLLRTASLRALLLLTRLDRPAMEAAMLALMATRDPPAQPRTRTSPGRAPAQPRKTSAPVAPSKPSRRLPGPAERPQRGSQGKARGR
jgi:hypothetical protein